MAGVVWHSVALAGFGPYRDKVTHAFPEEFGVLVAPNETGKSTLVMGLMATLYGLPSGGSPQDFGQARFRHKGRAPAFQGEVEFTAADGARYHVWRNFENHEVIVTRQRPSGAIRVFEGEHNPGARRVNQAYEDLIASLVGFSSRELLAATFCVTQPLPEIQQVDHSIQHLLAGAGGGRPQQALERLELDLRKLTRYPASYGFRRNLNKDRELERLQDEVRSLTAQIEQARAAVDGYHLSSGRLREVEEQHEQLRKDIASRRLVVEALQEWQRLAEKRRDYLRQWNNLRKSLVRAREVEAQLQETRKRLEQKWPELAGLPPETGSHLQELIQLESEAEQRQVEVTALNRKREQSEQAAAEAEDRLRTEFGDVAGRTELPRDVRELRGKLADLERLEKALASLADEEAHLAAQLAGGPDWGRLGHPAEEVVRRLRTSANDALRHWERYLRLKQEMQQTSADLERYALFAEQPQELIELVRNYHVLEAEAKHKAEVAATRAEDLTRRIQRLDEEAARLRQDFDAVIGLDEALIRNAGEKVRLLERQERIRAELTQVQQEAAGARPHSQPIGAAVGGLLGFGIGWVAGNALPSSLSLIAAVVLAVLGLAIGWSLSGRLAGGGKVERALALEREAQQVASQLAGLDLGPLASEPPLRLNLLVQQWQEWRRRSEALEEETRSVLGSTEASELRQQSDRADEALKRLTERLRPFTELFEDPSAALIEWEQRRKELDRHRAELANLCQEEWGVPADQVEALPLTAASQRWSELAELADLAAAAGLSSEPPARMGDLAGWLKGLTAPWWDQVAALARAREVAQSQLDELKANRRRLTQPGADGESPPERLRQEIDILRERVAPFDEQADPTALQERIAEAEALHKQAGQHRAAAQALQAQEMQVTDRLTALKEQAGALRTVLAPALTAVLGDPLAAQERWRTMTQAQQQVREWEKELAGILTASEVPTVDALESKVVTAEHEGVRLSNALEALIREHPGLPTMDEAEDPLVVRNRIEAIREEQKNKEGELDRLDGERRGLRDQLQDLGRETTNVAEAESRLKELRQRERELQREIQALAVAHKELAEALRVYQETYRDRLEAAATDYWGSLTGREGRRVRLNDGFAVSVLEPDGSELVPGQLSKGAQDQLYLALRLAIGDLISDEIRLPFVFDDPFLNCDGERLTHIRAALDKLSGERQVLLLSHRSEFGDWGADVVRQEA